jgi:ABC-type nitrate/sulfonate/bicarbonate transport system ATPase subunit
MAFLRELSEHEAAGLDLPRAHSPPSVLLMDEPFAVLDAMTARNSG